MRIYDKDPAENLPYTFNWPLWLAGDTITGTPLVTVDAGLTTGAQSNTTTAVIIWLSGGTLGVTYKVACRITTAAGKIAERTIGIRITDR